MLKINLKLKILLAVLLIIFFLFLFFYYKENNYTYNYNINNYEITEKYNSDNKLYTYTIENKLNKYEFSINGTYSNDRGLINKITDFDKSDNACINIEGKLEFYEICTDNENYYFSYEIIENDIKSTYKNVNIYNIIDKNFYIWDYKGLININKNNNTFIDLLQNDKYIPSSNLKLNDILFIPNYDNQYYFDTYYIIDLITGDYKENKINIDININSKFVSYEEEILRLYDDKTGKAYDINLSDTEVITVNGLKYTSSQLSNFKNNLEKKYFTLTDNQITYEYNNNKIKLEFEKVDEIIFQNECEVIFINESKVYYYKIGKDITLLFESEEWKFNYTDKFYIY